MVGKLRRYMIYTFLKSLSSPATKLSSGDIVHTSRLPIGQPPLKQHSLVPLQIRVPAVISSQRPRFILRAQLLFDDNNDNNNLLMSKQTTTAASSLKRQLDETPQDTNTKQQQQQSAHAAGGRKKKKTISPEVQARLSIQMAAKSGDVQAAFAAYDTAVDQKLKLSSDVYVTLMFLSSGGDEWEELLESNDISDDDTINTNTNNTTTTIIKKRKSLDSLYDFLQRCSDIMTTMQDAGHKPTEMCYTALARRDALLGKPEDAFTRAQELVQLSTCNGGGSSGSNITTTNNNNTASNNCFPRLRCFTPALAAYAVRKDAINAFRVFDAILATGLEPTESEYRRLIQAAVGGGVEWSRVDDVLNRMARELTVLTPSTIQQLKHLFNNGDNGGGDTTNTTTNTTNYNTIKWIVDDDCTIDENGNCSTIPGSQLEAIDLNDEEYSEFKKGIAELAARQERQPNNFKSFVEWLNTHGPYGVIIDGANVAFYGQNYESGGFSFAQIEAVVNKAQELHPTLRPLVLLHVNREKMPQAKTPSSQAFLNHLRSQNQFYATPLGSNDDWYWIYSAVAAGSSGILISNDEMRDHMFNLLAPKFFNKWKQRHQMRYTFAGTPSSLEFSAPPPYTTCSQYLDEYNMWVFPCSDGTWMSARQEKKE